MNQIKTADLYDAYGSALQVATPLFRDYGGCRFFSGPAATLKVFEDNTLVRAALESAGHGRVLVVDGGGSLRCALVGDRLAQLAIDNGWTGIIVHGCIRDSAALAEMDIGVKAIAANPAKSAKRGEGQHDVAVSFAGVTFAPQYHVYADPDGVVVSRTELEPGAGTRYV